MYSIKCLHVQYVKLLFVLTSFKHTFEVCVTTSGDKMQRSNKGIITYVVKKLQDFNSKGKKIMRG